MFLVNMISPPRFRLKPISLFDNPYAIDFFADGRLVVLKGGELEEDEEEADKERELLELRIYNPNNPLTSVTYPVIGRSTTAYSSHFGCQGAFVFEGSLSVSDNNSIYVHGVTEFKTYEVWRRGENESDFKGVEYPIIDSTDKLLAGDYFEPRMMNVRQVLEYRDVTYVLLRNKSLYEHHVHRIVALKEGKLYGEPSVQDISSSAGMFQTCWNPFGRIAVDEQGLYYKHQSTVARVPLCPTENDWLNPTVMVPSDHKEPSCIATGHAIGCDRLYTLIQLQGEAPRLKGYSVKTGEFLHDVPLPSELQIPDPHQCLAVSSQGILALSDVVSQKIYLFDL